MTAIEMEDFMFIQVCYPHSLLHIRGKIWAIMTILPVTWMPIWQRLIWKVFVQQISILCLQHCPSCAQIQFSIQK